MQPLQQIQWSQKLNKLQKKSQKMEHRYIVTFIDNDWTIWAKCPLKHLNLDYNAKYPILLTAKHPGEQILFERAYRDELHVGRIHRKHAWTRKLDHWIQKCITASQDELRHMQTQERQTIPHTNGGHTPRTTWWTCFPIHLYRIRLLGTHHAEILTTYLEQ